MNELLQPLLKQLRKESKILMRVSNANVVQLGSVRLGYVILGYIILGQCRFG